MMIICWAVFSFGLPVCKHVHAIGIQNEVFSSLPPCFGWERAVRESWETNQLLISTASVMGCLWSLAKAADVNHGEFVLYTHTG